MYHYYYTKVNMEEINDVHEVSFAVSRKRTFWSIAIRHTHRFTTFYHKFTRVVDLHYIAKKFAVKCFTMFCCFYNYVSKHFIFNDATKFCVIIKIFWIYISYLTPLNFIANHIFHSSCVVIIDKVLLTRETTFRSFFAQKFD